MRLDDVSPALHERLGLEATVGLLDLLDSAKQEWGDEMMEHTVARFEHRLTAEITQVRIELKKEISDLRVEFKQDLSDLSAELKQDLGELKASVNQSLLEQTRWLFGMWVGQVIAIAAIVAAMFRIYEP